MKKVRHVIAVRGARNSGKTTAIRKTWQWLEAVLRKDWISAEKLMKPANSGGELLSDEHDIKELLVVNDQISVGFCSAGDGLQIVRDNFEFFKNSCDIYICAVWSSGQTVDEIISMKQTFGISLVFVEETEYPADKPEENPRSYFINPNDIRKKLEELLPPDIMKK